MGNRENVYNERKLLAEKSLIEVKKSLNIYSILRLIIFISAIVVGYFMYKKTGLIYTILIIIAHIALFTYVAKIYEKLELKKKKIESIIKINSDHISRINGQWKEFSDKGEEYLDSTHGFINDLDMFGKSSLFQWINVTETPFGRQNLKEALKLNKLPSKEEILIKQESLKELGEKVDFREELQLDTMGTKDRSAEIHDFVNWCKGKSDNILSPISTTIRMTFPIINLIFIVLVAVGKVPWAFLIILGCLSSLTLRRLDTETIEILNLFKNIKYDLSSYFKAIETMEKEEFKSELLNEVKNGVFINGEQSSKKVKNLSNYASWIYDRINAFYIILNLIFLWDYQVLYKLEHWRRENGAHVDKWFNAVGHMESLSSLSILSYNNIDWCTPIVEDGLVLRGEEVCHPTLLAKGVSNSFILDKGKSIMLITGSNMSGKSTFLRTLGFNLVLTYLGAPVRAKEFRASILNIYTCMRTGDNLEESISSFYAEILRVKNIVEASKRGEKIFFLLDEIFKGTNSLDRHTGAEILINQLSKESAMGLVSTHDLELCDLDSKNSKVVNYNFREYYANNELKFDYKLRAGKSQTRNAIYLMKMAGIEV